MGDRPTVYRRARERRTVGARITTALGSLILLAAACTDVGGVEDAGSENGVGGSGADGSSTDSGNLPVPRSETVHVTVGPDFTNFDSFNPFMPGAAQGGSGYQVVAREYNWYLNWATGETMMHRIEDFSYENDYQTLVLNVRDGVRWNDGEPFTAHDIVFTIEMLGEYPELIGSGHVTDWVESIEAVDDLTVRIELTRPNPRFHRGFAWGSGQTIGETVPQHIWEGEDPTEFDNYPPVETGPYVLNKTYPDLKMFVWERDDDYWGKELGYDPGPRYFVQSTAPPADINLSLMLDGAVDTTPPQIFGWELATAAATASDGQIETTALQAPGVIGIDGFNLDNPLLAEREGRWAIAKLLDRELLADLYPAAEETIASPRPWPGADLENLQPFHAAADAALERIEAEDGLTFDYDPEAAAALLDGLGYVLDGDVRVDPDGNPVELTILSSSAIQEEFYVANHLAEQLRDIGIDVNITTAEGQQQIDAMDAGNYDIAIKTVDAAVPAGQQGDIAEGLAWYRHRGEDEPIERRSYYTEPNPEFEQAVSELLATNPDSPEADQFYEEALYQFMRQMWGTPVVERTFVQTQNNTWWTGWPSEDDMYVPPFNWPPTFKFILFELEPAT